MWFGSEQRMQWVPAPSTGASMSFVGTGGDLSLEDGRRSINRSMQTHKEFQFDFPVQEASGLTGLDVFNKFFSGFYGDCDTYPVFFADPMNYDQNLFPPHFASPGLVSRGWASPVSDAVRAYINLVSNPSVETNLTGWTSDAGTGGNASRTRTLIGTAAVAGFYTCRVAWAVATSAVSGGFNVVDTPVLAGTSYDFSVYVRCSKIQRVLMTINWRDALDASISTTVGTQTVLAATTQTQLTVVGATAPVGAVTADIEVRAVAGTSGSNWAVGNWLEGDAAMITVTSATPPAYFDGNTPGAMWLGAANASSSTLRTEADKPASSDTPANSYNLPPKQGVFNVKWAANAYPDAARTYGDIPYAIIPIPPGYTLWLGASGSRTGTAEVVAYGYNTPAVQASPASTTPLTLLSSTGSTRLNASITGVEFVKVFIRRTTSVTSTITLSGMMAQLWPTGITPPLTGNYVEGKGHRGLKFLDSPAEYNYVLVDPNRNIPAHFKAASISLVEAQDRG